ncbi:MAG: GreA/GreB family elongation factor [Alphaproteobacteria bacterium]
MSRAFVKEPDGETVGDDAPELPVSPYPNSVTPRGLALLRAELDTLNERRRALSLAADPVAARLQLFSIERQIRYVSKRIESAIVRDPRDQPRDRVGFGATVTMLDEDGAECRFTIVGEDEANPAEGLISWVSPLAKALMDSEIGDEVHWRRPKGDAVLEVVGIGYEEPGGV